MNRYHAVFYEEEDGGKPVAVFLRYYKDRNSGVYKKCLQYIRALEEHGLSLPRNYIVHVEGTVWELRPEFGGVEYRLFFGSIGAEKFGIVSAYQKTWEQVPENVKKLAAERIKEMEE